MIRRVLRPADPALRWHGDAAPGDPGTVRIAHFGDCGWRTMPRSHGAHTGPGYPLVVQEQLEELGLGLEFSTSVVTRFEDLPWQDPTRHLRLSGDPDVVLVHVGAMYQRLILLPDAHWLLLAREAVGRLLGPFVFGAHRMLRPILRRAGRPSTPYVDAAGLDAFLDVVRTRWPEAEVAVLLPYAWCHPTRRQRELRRAVLADLVRSAAAHDVAVLDFDRLVPVDATELRCANGYNLNAQGSQRVGGALAAWVLEAVGTAGRSAVPVPVPETRPPALRA